MNILIWLIVGLIAGWLAGKVMRGKGFGVVGDIIVGLVGAVIGGWIFRQLGLFAVGIRGRSGVQALACSGRRKYHAKA
ncbi:MAG: GlsB/YeaQ/YmgE family stress response membrane protein [bacterium]